MLNWKMQGPIDTVEEELPTTSPEPVPQLRRPSQSSPAAVVTESAEEAMAPTSAAPVAQLRKPELSPTASTAVVSKSSTVSTDKITERCDDAVNPSKMKKVDA